ncbi:MULTISPECIES: signal peptide peptidase SppA [unclassified Pseudoalteromonas]|uniref:signal peptide peptidase SppA n=1 Tax=unclassified Pseudoalteromonas TaxID=194690 RepID=UPI000CF73F1F|nr:MULTISPECIES: signal peptide peptidase SppA [unclassified Pseudoalteromonas]MBS3796776.1 signal peptide peptidase SppA [Pseudoalteromonas sp. BDTF-M6]
MIKKVVKATWDGINFSRRLVVNIIFIVLVILVIASITSDDGEIMVPKGSVLNLNLNGYLVEQKRYVDPLDTALAQSMGAQDEPAEILVDDVVDVINKAAKDERIEAMLLNVQNLGGAHINKLAAIAKAIDAFKAQGKPVIASGYYYTQSQYYLAAHADEINLHPYGGVSIEGFGVYPVYFKDALDKLKITQHVFRVGTFKSAVEPLIRNDMSQAAKEANKEWLSHLWQQYKDEVASLRGFEQTNFDETLDAYLAKLEKVDGNGAEYALKYGWVDALKNNQELRQQLIDLVGLDDEGNSFRQIGFNDYLATFKLPIAVDNPLTEKVAVIVAKGTIVDGHRKAGEIGGDSTAALLREARNDDRVKAVVLRIDSGGGSMFASELIRREVIALKEAGKPVVASMGSVAASGGYWIASAANEIWAAPSTITGSIGVFGTIMTFENSAAKLGVYSDGVGTTELKGSSVLLGLNDKLAQAIQMSVENAYSRFLKVVSESRGLPVEEVDKIAQGRVWIATQAQELGLVDQLGDKQAAISAAAKLASLKHYDVKLIEQPLSPQDIFIQNLFGNAMVQSLVAKQAPHSASVGAAMQFDNFVEQIEQQVSSLKAFNDPEGIYARCLVCAVTN